MLSHPVIIPSPAAPGHPHDPAAAALALATLAADLSEGRRPDPAAAARFAAGVAAWLDHGLPLEAALGLRGRVGHEIGRSAFRRRKRNAHLRAAAALCDGRSAWQRALKLSEEISKFLGRHWPAWRRHDAPPPGSSALSRELFYAARCGSLPESPSQLHDLILNS